MENDVRAQPRDPITPDRAVYNGAIGRAAQHAVPVRGRKEEKENR